MCCACSQYQISDETLQESSTMGKGKLDVLVLFKKKKKKKKKLDVLTI